jgi:arylsulfatase A-like enzyme
MTMRESARLGVRLLTVALVFTSLLAEGTLSSQHAEGQAAATPNILIIVTDDQRSGLDVMPATRNLFRAGGTDYSNAFITTPLCCPSRSSIFTGRYAHNHGVTGNGGQVEANLGQHTTIQHYLQRAGYHTGLFGKYLNGWPLDEPPPFFDEWAVAATSSYYDAEWNVNGTLITIPQYSTSYIENSATDFLDRAALDPERPWFLYVAPFAPHTPMTPEQVYADALVPDWSGNPAVTEQNEGDKPPYVRKSSRTLAQGEAIRTAQYRTLMSVDDLVDSVFTSLRDLGEEDNTLAFFVSDNGYVWGEHGLAGKGFPYTPSFKVPMMMRWPGTVPAGRTDARIVGNIDIAPTIRQATGIPSRPFVAMDGKSLLDSSWQRNRILGEYWWNVSGWAPWTMTRTKNYAYIEYYDRYGDVKFREYYDERDDPWELNNILHDGNIANNPDVTALHRQLGLDRSCLGTSGGRPCP